MFQNVFFGNSPINFLLSFAETHTCMYMVNLSLNVHGNEKIHGYLTTYRWIFIYLSWNFVLVDVRCHFTESFYIFFIFRPPMPGGAVNLNHEQLEDHLWAPLRSGNGETGRQLITAMTVICSILTWRSWGRVKCPVLDWMLKVTSRHNMPKEFYCMF